MSGGPFRYNRAMRPAEREDTSRFIRRALALVVIAAAASGCAGVQPRGEPERPRIVVLDLAEVGPVLERVEAIAGERFELVSEREYRATARRLKARKMTPRHVAKVAGSLDAVAVVHARVRKKRRGRQSVTVWVRDGATGKVTETYRLTLRRDKLTRQGRRALDRKLLASVKAPPPPEPEAPPTADEAIAATAAEADKPDKSAKADKPDKSAKADKPDKSAKADKAGTGKPGKAGRPESAAAAEEEEDGPALAPVEEDERGQAIDDEMPPL